MAKAKKIVTKTANELAEALGLTRAEGAELEFRSELNSAIVDIVKKKKLTHSQIAKLVGSSRSRVTALLNFNTSDISTDLMLRVLASLGYSATLKIKKVA